MFQEKNIFIVGIKGVAMANLAIILKKIGKNVSGADLEEEFITDQNLRKYQIDYQIGFERKSLPTNVDLVIYSAAHQGINNPLVIEARKRKVKIASQAEILGKIMSFFKNRIAVCGSHGKTTTSSLLAYALINLNLKPSYLVGSPSFNNFDGGDYQKGDYFVVEADEYGVSPPFDNTPKFLKLNPNFIIETNIDYDHPDVYKNLDAVKEAFLSFFDNHYLILNIDDKNTYEIINKIKKISGKKRIITYGFSKEADFQIKNPVFYKTKTEFDVFYQNKILDRFVLSLWGEHNVRNATAVIAFLVNQGIKVVKIKKVIKDFIGAKRRFEFLGKVKNSLFFDDYAHHPAEIKATIEAAKKRFPKRKIFVFFQPHTFSRTEMLLNDFQKSLSLAYSSFVFPIFASAREKPTDFCINAKDIVRKSKNLYYLEEKDLIKVLRSIVKEKNVILIMGAGDIYKKFGFLFLKIEKNKELKLLNTLRLSSIASYFFEAKSNEDLINIKRYSLFYELPLVIIGGGSNIAFLSKKIDKIVVKNIYLKLEKLSEDNVNVYVKVSSGLPLSFFIKECIKNGWSGLEYLFGVPGTVGGAIYMNAKWTNPAVFIGDYLEKAILIDKDGNLKEVDKNYFQFAYDYSFLQKTKEILLEAIFKLKKGNPDLLKKKAEEVLLYRKKTQPFGVFTAGCFFQNIPQKEKNEKKLPTTSAGYLIDKVGLKGFSVGDFYISPIHANFIVNKGNGKQKDLEELLAIIKKKIKEKFDIELKEEVVIVK
mgnify:CR=1 FL=1